MEKSKCKKTVTIPLLKPFSRPDVRLRLCRSNNLHMNYHVTCIRKYYLIRRRSFLYVRPSKNNYIVWQQYTSEIHEKKNPSNINKHVSFGGSLFSCERFSRGSCKWTFTSAPPRIKDKGHLLSVDLGTFPGLQPMCMICFGNIFFVFFAHCCTSAVSFIANEAVILKQSETVLEVMYMQYLYI